MRSWGQKHFVYFGRCPPSNSLLLCCIVIVALITVLSSPSPTPWISSSSSQLPYIYRNYRRLREKTESDLLELQSLVSGKSPIKELEFCGKEKDNHVPCYNVTANQLAGFHDGDEYDRHCEVERAGAGCLVKPPKDYKIPLRWPAGRDVLWSSNVKITKDQFLSTGIMTKRLMLLEDNQIAFNSADGVNFEGIRDYSRQIAEMIGLGSDSELLQAGVRTVLDIECGFGSFGAHLFTLRLMTVCIGAYEIFGSQVQLALERGLPAIIGNFVTKQLPFPSLSFDMVHCSHCGINWDRKDGAFLIEVDRLLKPGGYFVVTSPANKVHGGSLGARNRAIFAYIEEFAQKICWSLLGEQDETFIWQKTVNVNCYATRKQGYIPLCKGEDNAGSYYKPIFSCITGSTSKRWVPIHNTSYRHGDSQLSSQELAIHEVHPEEFTEDSHAWETDLRNYFSLLSPLIFSDHPKRPGDEDPSPPFNIVRNVLDMNAYYGGLNSAFLEQGKSVWVMNVVPIDFLNTLPLIYARGFAGVLHDWCEPFPTYPRTYDMLHAMGLLSHHLNSEKCSISDLLLEMDRILRPEGWVILRDKTEVIEKARAVVTQIRWDARVVELHTNNDHQLLVCQKPFLKK